jgi:hypothetical protein
VVETVVDDEIGQQQQRSDIGHRQHLDQCGGSGDYASARMSMQLAPTTPKDLG